MLRRLVIAALCVLAAAPAAARGDADPASDILPTQNVFLPYRPTVSDELEADLKGVTAAAERGGFNIKVALIATPADLGGVPQLFNQPDRYANYLGREISFNRRQPLLIAMPVGLGTFHVSPRAAATVRGVKPEEGADGLARAALDAVQKIAKAEGKPIRGFEPESTKGGSSGAIFAIPVVLLVIVLAVITYRRTGDDDPGASPATTPHTPTGE